MNLITKHICKKYLTLISKNKKFDGSIILITHILPNQVQYFDAIAKFAPIFAIIAIPYSRDSFTTQQLKHKYSILTPTLSKLTDEKYLAKILIKATNSGPVVIQEIGGYCAKALQHLPKKNLQNICGIVEDTEDGYRYYKNLKTAPCPIISVARSSLKTAEDALVGGSCLFSTEKIIRELNLRIEGKQALVLGFGKIGRGLAHALQRRSCRVYVYDTNHIRRLHALSEGFAIPDKNTALNSSDLIFGATGLCSLNASDFIHIRNGAFLISCSSKKKEFNLKAMWSQYQVKEIENHVEYCKNKHNAFYLLAGGYPINFLDNSSIGPLLTLTHAEMLIAIQKLATQKCEPKLQQLDEATRFHLAEVWLQHFLDPISGHYKHE